MHFFSSVYISEFIRSQVICELQFDVQRSLHRGQRCEDFSIADKQAAKEQAE